MSSLELDAEATNAKATIVTLYSNVPVILTANVSFHCKLFIAI